jgi:penicillin-binding protein 2
MRINIIRNIIIGLFLLIVFDLVYLQVIRGGYFFRQSESNSIRIMPFEGKRGRILDRNGKVLADNKRSFCIAIIPQDQKDKKDVFRFLSGVLNVSADMLEARFKKNKLTPFSPVVVAEDITRQQAIVVEENTYKYPGLLVHERYRRYYPYGEAGAHVIGYVGKVDEERIRQIQAYGYSPDEPIGYSGIEERYNDELRAEPGGRQIQVNSRGQQVRLLSVREAAEGKDIVLTIDQSIQHAAYQSLEGRRGAVVVLDPDNGEVLALVSSPAFNPNDFAQRDDRSRVAGYLKDKDAPLINRAVGGQFPPGSVFKIPVSLAGLQERKFKPTDSFDCPGYFDLGDRRFTFSHAFGMQDFIQAMGHSANEYFFHIGLALGADTIARYASLFGLGERTGIDLPYEVKGIVPRRGAFTQWFAGDTANMSIGQGYVLTTPVQLARMMAVVENEGRFVDPHVTKTIGGVDVPRGQSLRMLALRPEVWTAVKHGLRAVVKMDTGTAHMLDIPGLEIYGKTGTAQAAAGKADHSWFAGAVKSVKSRFIFVVFLDHGGSSANAGLAAKNMLETLQMEEKI